MTINKEALDLIKSFEGWRANAYRDAVGVWTIGYGHTSMAGAPEVKAGMKITQAEGEAILQRDLQKYAKAIRDVVKVPLNDNQFGALVSWCYNVGPGNVRKSTLVRKLNGGDYSAVPSELAKWNKAGGKVLKGLVRRRAAEAELFRKPASTPASAQKPVHAPKPINDDYAPKPIAPEPAPVSRPGLLAAILAALATAVALGWGLVASLPCNLLGVLCQ